MPAPELSDPTILYLPRRLAEAVRDLLDASPSDALPGSPAGTLTVERAWLPIFRLQDQTATVITVLSADDSGQLLDRRLRRQVDVDIDISVQQLLTYDPQTADGKGEIDGIVDFAERCLSAAFRQVTDADGRRYSPLSYERTIDDDALREWNQVSVLFSVSYRTLN